ncbi:hypothetical protein Hdeb2414_s0028g00701791 [Helianthus debilis subsp. tardiflorus]
MRDYRYTRLKFRPSRVRVVPVRTETDQVARSRGQFARNISSHGVHFQVARN